MKIYSKTGDDGETGLLGGIRVRKSHLAVEVCGCLDETNSWLGIVQSEVDSGPADSIRPALNQIQNDLFDLGSRVAASATTADEGQVPHHAEFPATRIQQLETWIDEYQAGLPELKQFILPGGCRAGAVLHLARSVCRRSERRLVSLIESDVQRDLSVEMIYLNRLGDLLFVLARWVNQSGGASETNWSVTR